MLLKTRDDGRITEFAGHNHASKHTTHSIQRRTPEDMTILVFIAAVQAAVQLRVTNAAGVKARCARAAPPLHARARRSARCEMGIEL